MDLQYFIKILWNKKWILISLVFFAMVLTYLLFHLLPPTYKSEAILSTGIVKGNHIKVNTEDVFVQQHEIESDFSNLIATMKSRTAIRFLSFHLLAHELNAVQSGTKAFRTPSFKAKWAVSQEQLQTLITQINQKKDSILAKPLGKENHATFKKVALAYQYDFESLIEDLQINRIAKTDYVRVAFESENPNLSEFIVNNFCTTFIKYNTQSLGSGESEAVHFFTRLSKEKKNLLDQLTQDLNQLRQNRNIVNLEKQTETTVSLIKDLAFSKEEAQKEINGHRKNIQKLNQYLEEISQEDRTQRKGYQALNQELANTHEEIKTMLDSDQPKNEFTEKGENGLHQKELLRKQLIQQLAEKGDRNNKETPSTLQLLFEKKVSEELDLSLKEGSVESLNNKIKELQNQSKDLVIAESQIEVLNSQKELAMKEYLEAISKLNEAKVVEQGAFHALRFFEYGQVPIEPEKSKQLLFTAFAGTMAGAMGIFFFFLFQLLNPNLMATEYSVGN